MDPECSVIANTCKIKSNCNIKYFFWPPTNTISTAALVNFLVNYSWSIFSGPKGLSNNVIIIQSNITHITLIQHYKQEGGLHFGILA